MKIEILFPEIANLYGEKTGVKYLQQSIPEAEFIFTSLTQQPAFVDDDDVDMIFMGPMTENQQEIVIEVLSPYVDKIKEIIERNTIMLMVGNAFEIFLSYIENEDGSKIPALNIFENMYAKRKMFNRYNSLYIGTFGDIKIVSYKAQFSMTYGDNSDKYFCKTIRGDGINKETKLEGIKYRNFIGTYLLGPLTVINPDFTKYIKKTLGCKKTDIAFEQAAYEAYAVRLKEYENPELRFV